MENEKKRDVKKKYQSPEILLVPKVEDMGRLNCKQATNLEKESKSFLSAAGNCHYQCMPRCG